MHSAYVYMYKFACHEDLQPTTSVLKAGHLVSCSSLCMLCVVCHVCVAWFVEVKVLGFFSFLSIASWLVCMFFHVFVYVVYHIIILCGYIEENQLIRHMLKLNCFLYSLSAFAVSWDCVSQGRRQDQGAGLDYQTSVRITECVLHMYVHVHVYSCMCTFVPFTIGWVLYIHVHVRYHFILYVHIHCIHSADEGQPSLNNCLPFGLFPLHTLFHVYCVIFIVYM